MSMLLALQFHNAVKTIILLLIINGWYFMLKPVCCV